MTTDLRDVRWITFDLFGTVLDWRNSLAAELDGRQPSGVRLGSGWRTFVEIWADGYRVPVPWEPLDEILARAFYAAAERYPLRWENPVEAEWLSHAWSRLKPFPEVPGAVRRLRSAGALLAPLTNANHAMIGRLASSSGLWWDAAVSGEPVRAYKPDERVYRHALEVLGAEPSQVLHVAAHTFDLNAAARLGFQTALVEREGEPGSGRAGLDHRPAVVAPTLDGVADAFARRAR